MNACAWKKFGRVIVLYEEPRNEIWVEAYRLNVTGIENALYF